MISPGLTLENPVTGERFTFTHTAGSTRGELLGFDFALRPGGAVPIPHVHPIQTERFEVLDGLMTFRVGLRKVQAGPGDVVESPRAWRTPLPTAGEGDAPHAGRGPAGAGDGGDVRRSCCDGAGRADEPARHAAQPAGLAVLARKYDQ